MAKLVAIALANFAPQRGHPLSSTSRVWRPLFCHALLPAQHFRGREVKLRELKDWLQSSVTPDRVVSPVAAGGTGKTALVDRALHEAALSDRAGLLVWSFYEDPHTEGFVRAAYTYFTGERETPAGGILERLQLALSGGAPHVLILDGLERVQSESGRRRRGELEDLQIKRLLRTLAGGLGSARALVTSRLPLVDLDEWIGAGHRAIALDDLECPVALEVLRAWKVQGDDAALSKLIEPLNVGDTTSASRSRKSTWRPETHVKPSKSLATPLIALSFPTVSMRGATQMGCTSADSPTYGSANATSADSDSPQRWSCANVSATDAWRRLAVLSIFCPKAARRRWGEVLPQSRTITDWPSGGWTEAEAAFEEVACGFRSDRATRKLVGR